MGVQKFENPKLGERFLFWLVTIILCRYKEILKPSMMHMEQNTAQRQSEINLEKGLNFSSFLLKRAISKQYLFRR